MENIVLKNLSDVNHIRIVKWLYNNIEKESYSVKKINSNIVISATNKLSEKESELLNYYIDSQYRQ